VRFFAATRIVSSRRLMSRSWESAMPMALRYSSLERKRVSSERARSRVSMGAGEAAPPSREAAGAGISRTVI
jgi:hypothetical protein